MYLIGRKDFHTKIKESPIYVVRNTLDEAMPYVKEEIRKLIVQSDDSLEEGSFCMLDSADDKGKPFTYYQFDVYDTESNKAFCRYEIIELVPGSYIYL